MNINGLKIYLLWGPKGNGKSLYNAYIAQRLFKQYDYLARKYPQLPRRCLYSNSKFSTEIEKRQLQDKQNLHYWTSPRELVSVRNADILWDEIGKDLPATNWADTPSELKQVFSHLRKRGNRMFANTQVMNDIDISFKRQIDRAFKLTKIIGSRDISATLPPVKRIWGVLRITEYDKDKILAQPDIDLVKPKSLIPSFLLMRRRYIQAYDTTSELPPYRPMELEHLIYKCSYPNCTKHIQVEHRKI